MVGHATARGSVAEKTSLRNVFVNKGEDVVKCEDILPLL